MRGCTMLLIGPDGSGKTTFAKRLCEELGPRARYMYLGSNPTAATHMLPSTRVWIRFKTMIGRDVHHSGPPDPAARRTRPRTWARRLAQHLKSLGALALRASEDAYRFLVIEVLLRRGHVLVLDRHPYPDYYAERVAGTGGWRRWGDRIHGYLLERVYPRPDTVVLLDAPADVLLARKHEGSIEAIEARRREYREVAERLGGVMELDVREPEEDSLEALRNALAATEAGDVPPAPRRRPPGAP
jgi:thymidylate kinase